MSEFNFKWYNGKKSRKEYQHDYYINVTKPKRQRKGAGMSEISETEIKSMTKEQNYFRGYFNGKSDTLDKIRFEIVHLHDWAFSREEILRIIDKYKAESEDKE